MAEILAPFLPFSHSLDPSVRHSRSEFNRLAHKFSLKLSINHNPSTLAYCRHCNCDKQQYVINYAPHDITTSPLMQTRPLCKGRKKKEKEHTKKNLFLHREHAFQTDKKIRPQIDCLLWRPFNLRPVWRKSVCFKDIIMANNIPNAMWFYRRTDKIGSFQTRQRQNTSQNDVRELSKAVWMFDWEQSVMCNTPTI